MPLKSISVNVDTPVALIFVVDNLVIVDRPTEFISPVTFPVTPPTNDPVNVVAVIPVPVIFPKNVVEVTAVPVKLPVTLPATLPVNAPTNEVAVNVPRTVELCSVSKMFEPV